MTLIRLLLDIDGEHIKVRDLHIPDDTRFTSTDLAAQLRDIADRLETGVAFRRITDQLGEAS